MAVEVGLLKFVETSKMSLAFYSDYSVNIPVCLCTECH